MMDINENAPASGQLAEGAKENTQADYSTADQNLCSGYGQYHTPNADKKNPRPLITCTLADIEQMLVTPNSVAKKSAQWFIPSTLLSRTFAEQYDDGEFWALWAGDGPRFIKLGRHVRYRADDVLAWIDESARTCSGEALGA